jgi:uroporphyrinogen-III synthase
MSERVPCRILITRPRLDAGPLAAALAAHGIDSLIEPLMETVFVADAPIDFAGVQAVVATSANGVRALAAREHRSELPLYAVGDATARAARDAGFTAVSSAAGDVEALADMIIARVNPARGTLLHVAGTISAGDLAGRLAAAGFVYRRTVLYRMEPAQALSQTAQRALASGALSAAAFYSPRTGAIFSALIAAHALEPACQPLSAYCLSAAVADRIAHLCWARTVLADRPDQSAMLAAILAGALTT